MSEEPSNIMDQSSEAESPKLPPERPLREEDPAQKSLADALQISFRLLKYAMVLLL